MAAINTKHRLILNFHGLGPVPVWVGSAERKYWCDVDCFKSILESISDLSQQVSIEMTFDDGNVSDAVVALPALVGRGLNACFFVCAGRIGQSGYLDKFAIRDVVSAGLEIGSHGWEHVDWRRVDDKTLDIEVDDARRKIADVVGRDVAKVAIPFGSYDRRVLQRLRRSESEIKAVFTTDGGLAPCRGWWLPREPYKVSWDDRTLTQLVTPSFSINNVRRPIARFIKRWR